MQKKKGFTLIELLAVIVVLALLLVIAVPTVLNIRNNAMKGMDKEQRKNIEEAAKMVGIDLDDYKSSIYNCKSSWPNPSTCEDEDGKWTSVKVTVEELRERGYFTDETKKCSGDITITKGEYSMYEIDLSDNVTCG